MRRKRFGVLGRIAVLSAVLFIALGLLLGAALHRSVRERAVDNAVSTGTVATNVGIRPLIRPDDLDRDFAPLEPERLDELDQALSGTQSDSGIVLFKLWNRQHWVVYSDEQDLRGQIVVLIGGSLYLMRSLGMLRFRKENADAPPSSKARRP